MVKKAKIKQTKTMIPPGANIIQLPKPFVVNMATLKKPKVKPKFDFDYCLKQLQSYIKEPQHGSEDYSYHQDKILKGLIQLLDNKQIASYLFNKFKNSRFKSYKMAMRTFTNLINGYFDGSVEMSGVISYRDTIPNFADERWYEEFNDFRYEFIEGLRNDNREYRFLRCIEILVEAESTSIVGSDPNNYIDFLETSAKLRKLCVIDLMELVWPDKGGTLKLLFGV